MLLFFWFIQHCRRKLNNLLLQCLIAIFIVMQYLFIKYFIECKTKALNIFNIMSHCWPTTPKYSQTSHFFLGPLFVQVHECLDVYSVKQRCLISITGFQKSINFRLNADIFRSGVRLSRFLFSAQRVG